MREWLNAVLGVIGVSSLTDEEYASMNLLPVEVQVYNQASYDVLAKVLAGRESISTTLPKLAGFWAAKGFTVTPIKTGKSNILLGMVLE